MRKNEKYIEQIKRMSKRKRVYIYGAGVIATDLYWTLQKEGVCVDGFCVTDTEKNVKEIDGKKVIMYKNLKEKEDVLFIIATKMNNANAIEKRLIEDKICSYIMPMEDQINAFGVGKSRKERANLEITTKIGCSINCRFCPQNILYKAYLKNKNRDVVMKLSTFERCLRKIPQDTIITFSGFCEPFLNVNCIDMMEIAVNMGYDITLNTTLVGVNEDIAFRLKKLPIKHMIFHTPDVRNYSRISVDNQYLKIVDMLLDVKMSDGKPLIKTANSHSEPPDQIKELLSGRVTYAVDGLQDIAGNIKDKEVAMNINLDGEIICSQSKELNRNVLLPDGTVVLCCLDYGMKHILGNLMNETYEEIINSVTMQNVKKAMKNNLPVLCRNCCLAKKME